MNEVLEQKAEWTSLTTGSFLALREQEKAIGSKWMQKCLESIWRE
ncbi:hypothetical protein [Lachnoclostridium sp. An181]|nr:hypothetical protein [Lachnoclostridium sp. An181]